MAQYEQNRKGWNEAILVHRKAESNDNIAKIRNDKILNDKEIAKFNSLNIENKVIGQLCCNNGRELMAIVKMFGAKKGVGFDISDEAIHEANLIKKEFDLDVDFVRTNVLDIASTYYNTFDLIYLTVGTLNWIEDLNEFFNIINKLLKANGKLFIYEMHPITKVFSYFNSKEYNTKDKYSIIDDYFKRGEDKYSTGLDYIGKTSYESVELCEYLHTLSDIINAIAFNKFSINEFNEYKEDISMTYEHIEEKYNLPLSYMIIASK